MVLTKQKCVHYERGGEPLKREEFSQYLDQVTDWEVLEDKKLQKNFKFKNFKDAMVFVNKVADLAESENHHPNIFLHGWNKVRISLTTFALKGLSLNDFIMAAKIDKMSSRGV